MKEQPKNYIDENGDRIWYLPSKGKNYRYRLDGPAIEWADGTNYWYVDGKCHREDGPAIERANGTKEWYVGSKRHRLDGPAVEDADGIKEWWVDNKLHRLDGPAIEWADGTKYWFVDGKQISPEEWFIENGIDPNNMTEEDAMAFKLRWT